VDQEGKDSWRHKQAGAHTVVISSPDKIALIRDVEKDLNLDEIRDRLIQDVDLILSEGYKKDVQPKIEVFRKEIHKKLLCAKKDNLVAIASNKRMNVGIPCFDLEDMNGLSNFIEKEFLESRKAKEISLKVNGEPIPLSPFVKDILIKTIKGMVSSLKGCERSERIEMRIEE
jgi:molybdopterin-guanine dinucleotide biosynthesis protein B